MNIIYNKNTGIIEGGIQDDQDYKVYYSLFPREFQDSIDCIRVDNPPNDLINYKIIDGKLVKRSYDEIQEIKKYGKILTEEERQEIVERENQSKKVAEETQAIQTFAKMSFQMTMPSLTPTQVLQFEPLVDDWILGEYIIGDIRKHNGQVWKCVQSHDNANNPDIEPGKTPAIWSPYHSKDAKYAKEYIQPTGVHDAYMQGEYCIFEDKTYKSIIDNNVWAPIAYQAGWKEVI